MRIILILLATIICTSSYGQLKQINISDEKPTTQTIHIEVPDVKKNIVNQRVNGTWTPTTMQYPTDANEKLVVRATSDGMPILITGLIPADDLRGLSVTDRAMDYLAKAGALMGIANPTEEWSLITTIPDDLDMDHVKYQQVHKGVPIYGAEVIVHGNSMGMFAVNGRYEFSPSDIDLSPSLSSTSAQSMAEADLGDIVLPEEDRFGIFDHSPMQSELVIYNHNKEQKLAHHFTIYKNIVERWEYFIDAHNGDILQKHESICRFHNHEVGHECSYETEAAPVPPVVSNSQDLFGNNKSINTFQVGSNFFMIDAARSQMFDAANSSMPNEPIGTIWTIDAFDTSPQKPNFNYDHVASSNMNFPGKQTAVSAHINGGKAFDYFLTVHSRVSINGQGGNIISLINVADEDGGGMDNAFWNGQAMFYGNGKSSFRELARGLDVAGHEMTHGVVQSSANLQYVGESGALNESFADVFGVMIDRDDWLVGEDVVKTSAFPSGALRSMQDPHNGASTNDFGRGWQPKTYSERFTGPQDNNGVHINSGIPNHAFFLFATHSAVGKTKAEKVYYRALTKYLTKSSQFVDARIATVRAAQDLYGDAEVAALRSAWDAVGVLGENGTDYEVDVETNPGTDLIVFTTVNAQGQNDIFIANPDASLVFNPASQKNPISQPSVTDDGSEILFVTDTKELGYIFINWENGTIERDIILNSDGGWRNAIFSKDGLRMAALRDVQEPEIFIFDFVSESGTFFELSNPTFSQDGTSTGDVQYADALEFDFTGEFVMYDAFNKIESIFGNDIEYWDIGFVKVWNNSAETFALEGQIEKLFTGLPEGLSIGNPTFSKNSPFIIAYDELEGGNFTVKGANTETNQVATIFAGNDRPGYPSFSRNDDAVIFDAVNSNGQEVVAAINLGADKISGSGQAGVLLSYDEGVRWGVWFSNGDRVISAVEDEDFDSIINIYPNPTSGIVHIDTELSGKYRVDVIDMMGKVLKSSYDANQVNISELPSGQYIISVKSDEHIYNKMISKL